MCEWDLGDIQFKLRESCMVITDLADFHPCITGVIRNALDNSSNYHDIVIYLCI